MQDAELLTRIGQGDRAAMKVFYERHQAGLYRFIKLRLGDAFEAADVMQEAFLEVWKAAGRFRGQSSVKTWLYGIARNKAVDRVRKAQRVSLRDAPDDTLADDSPSAQAVMEAAADARKLKACLGKLPEVQQSAVRLAFYEDLSYPQAAEVEGVPVGTIKTRIHHAKKLLMRCLTREAVTV
ncbi:RNA polymerase sigma factor [Marinibacterium sp. SX1]|uniref:RNA polymerase sigma factor n=1 Tax=Marinibacterium sp. SX1 TaxID=3388424 RepID=UPI003D17C3C1